jgi:hypothetical protein
LEAALGLRAVALASTGDLDWRATAPPPRFPTSFIAFHFLELLYPLDYQGVLKTISFHVRDLLSTFAGVLLGTHVMTARDAG